MDERSRQDLLESAEDVRLAALYLQESLMRGGDEGFLAAREEYRRLVERFRRDHPGAVTERQYRNALEDLEYLLILIEQAIDGYRRDGGS